MILESCENLRRYTRLHPGIQYAFEFLKRTDLHELPDGKFNIADELMYASVSREQGKGMHNAVLEAHRRFIDVQVVIDGEDYIGWKPFERCLVEKMSYNEEKDLVLFNDAPETWFGLVPGMAAVFFPGDAHAPLAVDHTVHKVVLKIAVNW